MLVMLYFGFFGAGDR